MHWCYRCCVGLAAGPVLWLAVNTAIAIKTGNTDILAGAAAGAASSSAGISEVGSGALLLGAGLGDQQQVPVLLLSAAVSPAGGFEPAGFRLMMLY